MAVVTPKGTNPGSREWLESTAKLARSWSDRSERDVRQLVAYLHDLRQHDWAALIGGEKDWSKLCREVIGHDPDFLAEMEAGVRILESLGHSGPVSEQQARRAQQLAADPGVKPLADGPTGRPKGSKNKEDPAGENNSAIGTIKPRGTNSAETIIRRLKRDAPEVAQALARGEYKSARAAGIAAGIVNVPSALDLLKRAWAKATKKQKDTFVDWINEEGW